MADSLSMFHTSVSEDAIARAAAVLRSGWVNEGEVTREFESELARVLGVRNAVAVNSGTAALHLALVLAGVGSGDEVVLPAQTFAATGMVVLIQGATPVFADINPRTGNIDPASARSKITSRTKAIICVHWGGYPCDLEELQALSAEHGVALIEDAAHALGATYAHRPIGSISAYTAFSFQAIKHLTTGDGGALCCADEQQAAAARRLRWFGIDRADVRRTLIGARGCDIREVGYKYHMNNVAAALGIGNLHAFPARLARRRAIAGHYRERLADVPGVTLLEARDDREHAWWLFTILVERREDFVRALASRRIAAGVVDLRIDRNSVFGGPTPGLEGQEAFDASQVAIPVHDGLDDGAVERIVSAVRAGW